MKTFFSFRSHLYINHKVLGLLAVLLMSLISSKAWAEQITLANADFEEWNWNDSVPLQWLGTTSNIDVNAVTPDRDAYSGNYACRLVKTQKTHARFSSQTLALKAGNYQLSYYAKGSGNVRNSYHKGTSYDPYSEYTALSENEWKKIDYTFEVKADIDSAEIIFSVASTSKDGILIDALSLQTVAKVETALSEHTVDALKFMVSKENLSVDAAQACQLQVFDVLGKKVLENTLSVGVNSFSLESGLYLVLVNGQESVQKIYIP